MDIPCFMSADPAFWFTLIESVFESKQVNNVRDKINAILLALPNHLQLEAKPILSKFQRLAADDAAGKLQAYDELKLRIITLTSIPEEQRLQELLDNAQIGTRTPTQFLNHIRNLQGDAGDRNNKFLRTIFVRELPTDVRNIIIAQKYDNLDDMAATADLIWKKPNSQIFCMFGEGNSASKELHDESALIQHIAKMKTSHDEETKEFRLAIAKLSKQLDDLQCEFSRTIGSLRSEMDGMHNTLRSHSLSQRDSQRSSMATGKWTQQDSGTWCYFHQKFGGAAFRCSQPCSFSNKQGN